MQVTVRYAGSNVATFTDAFDAIEFARNKSRQTRGWCDVSNKTGLVDQFRNGHRTPEFEGLNALERDGLGEAA